MNVTAFKGGIAPALKSFALPVAILVLVAMMVVPVPTFLLDAFFIMNIVISLAVLMVALNAQKPLDFSAFVFTSRTASTVPRRPAGTGLGASVKTGACAMRGDSPKSCATGSGAGAAPSTCARACSCSCRWPRDRSSR